MSQTFDLSQVTELTNRSQIKTSHLSGWFRFSNFYFLQKLLQSQCFFLYSLIFFSFILLLIQLNILCVVSLLLTYHKTCTHKFVIFVVEPVLFWICRQNSVEILETSELYKARYECEGCLRRKTVLKNGKKVTVGSNAFLYFWSATMFFYRPGHQSISLVQNQNPDVEARKTGASNGTNGEYHYTTVLTFRIQFNSKDNLYSAPLWIISIARVLVLIPDKSYCP